jgi:large subunit ribosomal protein L13
MKTHHPKLEDLRKDRKWHLIDADGLILGKLAVEAAVKLRGKDEPNFHPSVDCGDNVVVINAEKVVLTGNKEAQKMYHTHSGYPGALKSVPAGKMREKHPERIVEKAIGGMIPRNRLKKIILGKLYVYAGAEHPHASQDPKPLTIK